MPARLYSLKVSHPALAVRAMLEHKGIEHRLVDIVPGMHPLVVRAVGFRRNTVPALVIGGRRIQGSRQIARALDEIRPDPPLFPHDPAARQRVEDAERWGEELQNAVRRIFYCAARRDRKAFLSVLAAGRGPVRTFGLRMFAPVVIKLATGLHRASDEAGREDVELIPERLDQIDAWIAEGILGGAVLNAADFQIGVNVSALLLSDDLIPYVEGRPAADLARRVFPDYAGHIGPVVPPEWMDGLRAAAEDNALRSAERPALTQGGNAVLPYATSR